MTSPSLFSPITPDEKRSLLSLCLIAAKQTGFCTQDTTDLHNDRLLQLYKQWGGDKWAVNFKPFGLEMNVEEAAANFLTFCKDKAGELANRLKSREIKLTEISATFVVPIGQRGYVEFGLKALPPTDADEEELKEAFGALLQRAILGYDEYINHPPRLPVKKSYHAQSGDTQNVFSFTSIICKNEGGKRGYFVKGAQFVKYGIRVWPSTLSAAGIDVESIEGEKFIAGEAIYTKKSSGDPDLVIGMTIGANNL